MNSIHYFPTPIDDIESLLHLTTHPLWRSAAAARNAKAVASTTTNNRSAFTSPGLVLVLQGADQQAGVTLGCSLIEQGIDRVCLIRGGGAPALFRLPNITDYFVSPSDA